MGQGLMCPVPPQVGQAEGSGLGGHGEAGQAQRAGPFDLWGRRGSMGQGSEIYGAGLRSMGQVGIYEVLGLWGWDLWIGAIYGAGISDLWVRDLRSMGQAGIYGAGI